MEISGSDIKNIHTPRRVMFIARCFLLFDFLQGGNGFLLGLWKICALYLFVVRRSIALV